MAEYIDRIAFREKLDSHYPFDEIGQKDQKYDYAKSVFLRQLAVFPAADVVEVVRCKDCINHRQSGLCEGWSRYGTINTPDDAFCSWGVKIDV